MSLEDIKTIVAEMPEGIEKKKALQAYSNLKIFEVIAETIIERENHVK